MSPDVLIVGGGLAGSSVAYHLSSMGTVLVLEQSGAIAQGASKQNAGMIRRMAPEPCDRALAQRTHHFLSTEAPLWETPPVSRVTGAILGLVRDPLWLHNAVGHLRAHDVTIEPAQIDQIPALTDTPLLNAWSLPDERVADGPSLVHAFMETAKRQGARLETGVHVQRLLIDNGHCVGVVTNQGPVSAGLVVLAGGAWCAHLAKEAGLVRPLIPLRRMVGATTPDHRASDTHPWCWLDDVGCYVRPNNGAWLASPCDEVPDQTPVSPESTGTPTPQQWALLQHKIRRYFPSIPALDVHNGWTGLRTYTPDRKPLLGSDPDLPGLWWAAGLGGSGLSGCWGIGEALSTWISGNETQWLDADGLNPGRKQLSRWPILPEGYP
ncbi:MAG: NAD(P)/FAD-dependent oxidoreductase, partial [Myxococcota bacterium]